MKRYFAFVCVVFFLSGCASGTKKRFTVMTDPPDAVIRVVSGRGLSEDTYRSPAKISVRLPIDSILLAKNVLEVSRDAYKPKKMQLRDIRDNEVVNVKLDKVVHYTLKYRLLNPVQSDEIKFQDKILSISFVATEREFQMDLTNLTPYPIRILWDRSEYTDVNNRQHRLMHSGVRYQDRSNPIPAQVVPPKARCSSRSCPPRPWSTTRRRRPTKTGRSSPRQRHRRGTERKGLLPLHSRGDRPADHSV